MSHKGERGAALPRTAARGRGPESGPAGRGSPPSPRFPAAAARRPAAPRPERGGDASAPPLLCVPRHPPPHEPARPRGAGAPRLRCPSHAARGLSREQSAAARSRRHVPRPHPAQPAPQEHGGAAAAPADSGRPFRAALAASGRAKTAPRRGCSGPGPALRAARPGKLRAPPGGCPHGLTKPTRSGGWRPGRAPRVPRPPPTRARTKFGGPRAPAHATPPAGAQVPRGRAPSRPAACPCAAAAPLCSGDALTPAPGRNFPCPGSRAPRAPQAPQQARASRAPSTRGHCVRRAHPPTAGPPGQGPCGSRARPPPPHPGPYPAPPPARVRASERH